MKLPLLARRLVLCAGVLVGVAGVRPVVAQPPAAGSGAASSEETRITYPAAERQDVVDTYHGTTVADPYRWLEDPDAPASREWIEAQNKLTFGYLGQIPQRETIKARLTELINYERFGIPSKEGGLYFFSKNDGLQNQSVVYVTEALDAAPRVLINPNEWTADGTMSLAGFEVSRDGKYAAYGVSDGGSDWRVWRVLDVATGKPLTDELRWIKFSNVSWNADSTGFYYSRYDEPKAGDELQQANYFNKLYFHRLGTPQSEDVLVYQRPDQKEWGFYPHVTEDGAYLLIHVSHGFNTNALFYRDLSVADAPIVELFNKWDGKYDYVANEGPRFWFSTTKDAPRGRVVSLFLHASDESRWTTTIPESRDALTSVSYVGGNIIASYLKDAKTEVKVYDVGGGLVRTVDLPGIGSAGGFGGKGADPETFFSFTSFNQPATIYRYDVTTGETELFRQPTVNFNPDDYETKQVFFSSKDGTRVPMFIVHKKGIRLDGSNPTLLYGYGGFNISETPGFSVSRLTWMEMGGVFALPNLRGGGEYGEEWHQAGTKLRKQNVFDDFIAAAEWLIENRYTRPSKLGIMGGSNGGLLVGACMTQRPELFGACLPAVGVLDMLRYHKFTIGWAWASDYGTSEDPEEFKALASYSPYHNAKEGVCYPPTLITTADHDDRVVPAHSFKFAAALQYAQACGNPVMIRVETRAGHGAGTPLTKTIEIQADQWAFLVKSLGM